MINRKKLQQILFLVMSLNCCIILCITSISTSTDYWVIVRPVRQLSPSLIIYNNNGDSDTQVKQLNNKSTPSYMLPLITQASLTNNDNDYIAAFTSSEEEDELLPIDLHAKKDCKRYSGKIRFGLFKGVWLLNYAYGCKNRVNYVSSIVLVYFWD